MTPQSLLRYRIALAFFIVSLVLSGLTAFPLPFSRSASDQAGNLLHPSGIEPEPAASETTVISV